MDTFFLKVISDIPCEVYIDYELMTTLQKNVMSKISLKKGEYIVQFISTINPNIKIEDELFIEYERVYKVNFLSRLDLLPFINECVMFDRNSFSLRNVLTGKTISSKYYSVESGYFYTDKINVGLHGEHYGERIYGFNHGLMPVCYEKKWGLINIYGEEIVECEYDSITYDSHLMVWIACSKYLFGTYETCSNAELSILPIKESKEHRDFRSHFETSLCDIIDLSGEVLVNGVQLYNCEIEQNDIRIVSIPNGRRSARYGFLDASGRLLVPCTYERVRDFKEGFAAISKNKKWGFIDTSGREIVPCIYDCVDDFHEGFAAVWKGDEGLYINQNGYEQIVPGKYEYCSHFQNGWAILAKTSIEGYEYDEHIVYDDFAIVDRNGNIKNLPAGRSGYPPEHGELQSQQVNSIVSKCFLIDKEFYLPNGRVLFDYVHCVEVKPYKNGLAAMCKKGQNYGQRLWGFIDVGGVEVIPCKYKEVDYFNNTLVIVHDTNGRKSLFDLTGKQVTKWYFQIIEAGEGFWAIHDGNLGYGYMDERGREILPCQYVSVTKFNNGFARVNKWVDDPNGNSMLKWAYINNKGQEISLFDYDDCKPFANGYAAVSIYDKWGYINEQGFLIIPCVYSQVDDFYNNVGYVIKDGTSYYIDRYGNVL